MPGPVAARASAGGVARSSAGRRAWRGRPRERVPVICFLPVRLLIRCGAVPAGGRPGAGRHAVCRVHRGTRTRRLASSAPDPGAVCPVPGVQQHGQDGPGCTGGQLRLGRAEGHLDRLAFVRLRGGRISRGTGGPRQFPRHARRRLPGTACDSAGVSPARGWLTRPDLTSRAKWSADHRRCMPAPTGPARAASRRGVQGDPISNPGGE